MGFKQTVKRIPVLGFLLQKGRLLIVRTPSPVRGQNNVIVNEGSFNNVTLDIAGNNNEIRIGKNSSINNALIFIRGDDHRIIIKENCFFGKGEFWIEDDHCSIIIHSDTTIEHAHLAVTESQSTLEIQKDCMLAKHVEIRTGDSHSIIDIASGERINKAANVTLEEHVWIGAHAKILKGVTIGHNSVIGTSSLVTGNIPAHTIAAGVPAKVVRENTDWKRERI